MYILGISAFYHDSAACLVQDGEIIAAAQEERFTRKKHDPGFPRRAVEYCLAHAGIGIKDLKYVVFYDKPLIKFERLLETYLGFAPKGIQSFLAAMPVWLKEKLFLRNLLQKEVRTASPSLNCRSSSSANITNPTPRQLSMPHPMNGQVCSAWTGSGSGQPPRRGWGRAIH